MFPRQKYVENKSVMIRLIRVIRVLFTEMAHG